MNNLIYFGLLFVGAYALQTLLTLSQIKQFNKVFVELKRKGKVLIGRKGGRLVSGTLILFLIDDAGVIQEAKMMQGVTVFARFKALPNLVGEQILSLNETHDKIKKLNKFARGAVEDARSLYVRFLTNTMTEETYSQFTPFGVNLSYVSYDLKSKLARVSKKWQLRGDK